MGRHSSAPRYLKHASGQARVVINGKTFYLGKYNSTGSKQRYDTLIAEWLASGRSGSFGLESPNRLRHAKGTDTRKQFGLDGAQVTPGHAKADATQIYAEQDREKAIEIALKVG